MKLNDVILIGDAIYGFILFVGVPWLWGVLKPWIHSITG